MIFGLAAVAGNALGGRAADRYATTRLMVISTCGLTLALASFGALGSLGVHGSLGAGLAAVALVVWGVFGWSCAPLQQHRLVELAPTSAGIVLSLNASAIYIGISLGGFLGSLALDRSGAAAVGWTAAGPEILAVTTATAIAVRATASDDLKTSRPDGLTTGRPEDRKTKGRPVRHRTRGSGARHHPALGRRRRQRGGRRRRRLRA